MAVITQLSLAEFFKFDTPICLSHSRIFLFLLQQKDRLPQSKNLSQTSHDTSYMKLPNIRTTLPTPESLHPTSNFIQFHPLFPFATALRSDVTWRLARLSRTDLPGVRQISVAKVSEAALASWLCFESEEGMENWSMGIASPRIPYIYIFHIFLPYIPTVIVIHILILLEPPIMLDNCGVESTITGVYWE